LILSVAGHPSRAVVECFQMGRAGGALVFARHTRPYGDDPHRLAAGPASVDVLDEHGTVRLRVADGAPGVPFGLDLTFAARTRPYRMSRGKLEVDGRLVWDQHHVIQSGHVDGTYTRDGRTTRVDRWSAQRDHSWGVRDHLRCPMWMWLAIQLPDGMLGVWCWERASGERVYTDGCWAPAGGAPVIPVVAFEHELRWTSASGRSVDYGAHGEDVEGLAGRVVFHLAEGGSVTVEGSGSWIARYGRRGGGQHQMAVRTSDGRSGVGVYEVTGGHHHRYFPVSRIRSIPSL
jgi:hypothetical protein